MPKFSNIKWHTVLFAAAATLSFSIYWIRGLKNNEPMSVTAIYRHHDIQYYPLIRALADFKFGETETYEPSEGYVSLFPFPSMIIHAICWKLFGIWGLAIADGLVCLITFCLINTILKLILIQPIISEVSALTYCCLLKEFRLPRPFVTDMLELLCVFFIVQHFLTKNYQKPWQWALFGLVFALALQSNIYSGENLALGVAACGFLLWYCHPDLRKQLYAGIGLFCAGLITGLIPFILQRIYENPDAQVRYGVFPVSRSEPLFQILKFDIWSLVLLLSGAALLVFFKRIKSNGIQAAVSLGAIALWVISYASLPVSCVLLGKCLHIYHYSIESRHFFYVAWFVLAVCCANWIWIKLESTYSKTAAGSKTVLIRKGIPTVSLALIVFAGCYTANARISEFNHKKSHMRADVFEEYISMRDYRKDFVELTRELDLSRYKNCEVAATFDHQVCMWWLAFHEKKVFLSDIADSTLSDHAHEERLAALCAKIGMDASQYQSFISRLYVNVMWFGLAKYQASRAFTYAPLEAYSEADRARIKATTIYDNWSIILPETEKARMLKDYSNIEMNPATHYKLDLIILTNDDSLRDVAPSPEHFRLTFSNRNFRVYVANEIELVDK